MAHKGIRVLIAEDDDFIRLLLVEFLDAAGFDVLAARDGSEAHHLIEDPDGVDVLVSDFNMPGSHGLSVAKHLREMHPGVPVVFVTGRPEQVEGRELAPPFLCFTKPFRLKEVVDAVQEMLAAHSAGSSRKVTDIAG